MNSSKASFIIIVNNDCPLYELGDEFEQDGRSFSLQGKPACLTLMNDVNQALKSLQNLGDSNKGKDLVHLLNCSGRETGCTGKIRLKYQKEKKAAPPPSKKLSHETTAMVKELGSFSIFKTLSEPEITDIASYFRFKKFPKGDYNCAPRKRRGFW